jgi:hypothetical protein
MYAVRTALKHTHTHTQHKRGSASIDPHVKEQAEDALLGAQLALHERIGGNLPWQKSHVARESARGWTRAASKDPFTFLSTA